MFSVVLIESETVKVKNVLERLQNPVTKPLLFFLSYILVSMDRFNRLFQKSENTTCQLYKMSRLVRFYASNLLKPEVIRAAGEDLSKINLHSSCQLSDENLGIRDDIWASIAVLEVEQDQSHFLLATIQKMLKKFPFGDSLLKDLVIINPENILCSNNSKDAQKVSIW